MDKKTLTGFLIIGAMLIAFSYFNRPTQEQRDLEQRYRDSIATLQVEQQIEQQLAEREAEKKAIASEENAPDSVKNEHLRNNFGAFAVSAEGEEKIIKLENELLEVNLSTKGGRVISARLKDYTDYDSLPLTLFEKNEASFGLTLVTANNRIVNTDNLYFEPIEGEKGYLTMRLHTEDNAYLDFVYTLLPDDYMLRFEVGSKGLDKHLAPSINSLDLLWTQKMRQLEKSRKYEAQRTQLFYKFSADDVESLSDSKDDSKNLSNKLKWIGYKDQYFSTVLIADQDFESTKVTSTHYEAGKYTKEFNTTTAIAFDPKGSTTTGFYFFFGPNKYSLLKNYDNKQFKGQDLELEKLVYLGMSLFRFVNKWIIIPLFDFWTNLCGNVGIAILLLTLTIKIGLFPLTFKSFMSSAKMRVMRPQVEELNEKYPGQDNAMTRQQKTMELYRQAGVNPMSGCLPLLLQMPFLFSLFMFFPSAIELRHQSFLWAKDLSTYDAIISWDTYVPLITPYFGNHISLFCLLMTITNIIYTKYNMEQTNTGQQQMPGMKMMMYIMPLFMLVFLNQFPSGLNYYYFLSTLITIIQTLVFRLVVNEDKILAKLEQNKKKPAKKKSGFMARLEEAQRQQQAMAKQRTQQQKGGGNRKK